MKIYFLIPYPLKESPSQRFRFEQYFGTLDEKQHSYKIQSFLEEDSWRVFYEKEKQFKKFSILLKGFLKRTLSLAQVWQFDYVFIHREVTPLGPPIFEWLIAKVLRKKIVYDFDDAIWTTDRQHENLLLHVAKWRSKVKSICRWAHIVSCGNDYLCAFAKQYNAKVLLNPTTIDTNDHHTPRLHTKDANPTLVIGWTGSRSTLKYLHEIESVIQNIMEKNPHVVFRVIADEPPQLHIKSIQFKRWSKKTEIADLAEFDIGIMPLQNNEWSKGKCGFKALQYMALEIPTIASPVGVNETIIQHGKNGLLASSQTEWVQCLSRLIKDADLRSKLGKAGRMQVEGHYSVASNRSNFLELFE
jgi:glycosyltransferase involved in cell wall biosynthesis